MECKFLDFNKCSMNLHSWICGCIFWPVSFQKILGIVQEKSGTIQNDLFISFCAIVHLESEKTRNAGTVFIFRSFTFTARFARRELES